MALLFTGFVLAASAGFIPPATMAAQASAPRARARRICRDEPRAGSRFRSYRCLTETEWAEFNRQKHDNARETQETANRNIRADHLFYGSTDQPSVPRP